MLWISQGLASFLFTCMPGTYSGWCFRQFSLSISRACWDRIGMITVIRFFWIKKSFAWCNLDAAVCIVRDFVMREDLRETKKQLGIIRIPPAGHEVLWVQGPQVFADSIVPQDHTGPISLKGFWSIKVGAQLLNHWNLIEWTCKESEVVKLTQEVGMLPGNWMPLLTSDHASLVYRCL